MANPYRRQIGTFSIELEIDEDPKLDTFARDSVERDLELLKTQPAWEKILRDIHDYLSNPEELFEQVAISISANREEIIDKLQESVSGTETIVELQEVVKRLVFDLVGPKVIPEKDREKELDALNGKICSISKSLAPEIDLTDREQLDLLLDTIVEGLLEKEKIKSAYRKKTGKDFIWPDLMDPSIQQRVAIGAKKLGEAKFSFIYGTIFTTIAIIMDLFGTYVMATETPLNTKNILVNTLCFAVLQSLIAFLLYSLKEEGIEIKQYSGFAVADKYIHKAQKLLNCDELFGNIEREARVLHTKARILTERAEQKPSSNEPALAQIINITSPIERGMDDIQVRVANTTQQSKETVSVDTIQEQGNVEDEEQVVVIEKLFLTQK